MDETVEREVIYAKVYLKANRNGAYNNMGNHYNYFFNYA